MRIKGSMTVFVALSLLLVISFLMALLEGARAQGLNTCAELVSDVAIHSVCAEYQPVLWEDYKLLMLDGTYGTGTFSVEKLNSRLCTRISENIENTTASGMSLYKLFLQDAQVTGYQLATDGAGEVFLQCVASYMKNNLTREAAKSLYDAYQEGKEVEESDRSDYSVENANTAIEEAKVAAEEGNSEGDSGDGGLSVETENKKTEEPAGTAETEENPLDIVLQLKQNTLLSLVAGGSSEISQKQVNLQESVSRRENHTGTMVVESRTGWYEKILITEYLDHYFSNYLRPKENAALSYEMEYLLCGEDSDAANLEGTINRLLLMRETANIAAIVKDGTKRNEAKTLAELLAGFSGNPAIIFVVQCGIIAAWAYVESILDLRALLRGDKIALIKSDRQWTTNTKHLLESLKDDAKAINCENGLTYKQYIKQFVITMGNQKLAYRMMDVMEQNVRAVSGNEAVRMDDMVCRIKSVEQYGANPLFARLSLFYPNMLKQYSFVKEREFDYIR